MDSAQKTLIGIASVSQHIVNTLGRCVGRKTFELESSRLEKIVVGSRTVLEALNKTLLLKNGNADDRLVDWLNSEEPQACLQTLNQMEEILNRKVEYSGVKSFLRSPWSGHTQDKSSEAIKLFQMRKAYFHFLLTAGIWNRESSGAQEHLSPIAQPSVLPVIQELDERNLATSIHPRIGDHVSQVRKKNAIEGKSATNRIPAVAKLDSILGWLNAWNSRETHERTINLRQPDTCAWLPKTSVYKKWKSTGNSFLWLHGKPGAGKSVLAASVIEDLKDTLQEGEVLAYFYCNFREERSTSAAEVLRSLLSQLLRQSHRHAVDPGDLIDELVEEKDGGASTISNDHLLTRHVSRAAKQFYELPFLVIDALDECKDIEKLLDALVKLQNDGVRLLVTSRPLQIIKDSFSGLPAIDMEETSYMVSADIRLHVTKELDSHRRLRIIHASLKEEIYSALCGKADGMFRWVQCQLDILKQCVTASEFREALDDLPSDLDETYGRILMGMDKTMREGKVARRALNWLVVAWRPLRLSEVMEGISVDLRRRAMVPDSVPVDGAILLDALGSLVTYDEVTDIVILSHFSVKEYLTAESTRKKYPTYHVDQQAAHTQLALVCLNYFGIYLKYHQQCDNSEASLGNTYKLRTLRDNSNTVSSHSRMHLPPTLSVDSHPLLQYLLGWGFRHLSEVNPGDKAILRSTIAFHLDAQQHPLEWEQMCEIADDYFFSQPSFEHDPVLHILITVAPEPLFCSFIRHTKPQSKDGMNPLIHAVYSGRIEHARILLSRCTNPNHRGMDIAVSRRVLPLEVAARQCHHAMFDLLLNAGSHVPHKLFEQALMKSFSEISPRIVSRLIQTDEFVEWAADIRDEEPFLRALDHRRYIYNEIGEGNLAEQDIDIIERRLVQMGINPPPRSNEASLRYAVSAGHVSTVQHMLSLKTIFPTDIILDALHTNSEMMRILLDMGYGVDVTSPTGDTPLHLVLRYNISEDECFKKVHILVDAGCHPSARNFHGETPLHLATSRGHASVVEYLLSLQVPLPPDILLAIHHTTVVRSLIRGGADVHATEADGRTLLHHILCSLRDIRSFDDLLECVRIIVGAGCDPCSPDAFGETALDVAAAYGHLPVAQYLLSIGVPLSPSALLSVVGTNYPTIISMINLLIENGADVHATCPNGDTLLHVAMFTSEESECLKSIKILVNAGCDPRACNLAGRAPFHFAACVGYVLVMEYLLSPGIQIPSDVMFSPIMSPAPHMFYSVTRFLLDQGGDIHTVTKEGDTLLHSAMALYSEHETLKLVKFLVHAGCNPSTPNAKHELPFHTAARSGYISVVDYFLSLGVSLPPDILLAAPTDYTTKSSMLRYLVEKGANVSVVTTDGDTPLHLSVTDPGNEDDHLECVKILIDAGCDPLAQNVSKRTPMHAAAESGSIAVMEYLLSQGVPLPDDVLLTSAPSTIVFLSKKGVDVRYGVANIDMHLLHCALDHPFGPRLECVKILINAGWNPSRSDSAGETPLHIVARRGDFSTIQYLLSQGVTLPPDVLLAAVPTNQFVSPLIRLLVREGANVNAAAPNGDTSLHLALRSECILDENRDVDVWGVVKILLDAGADPSSRNADGQTPFGIAEANGRFFNKNFLRLVRDAERVRSNS